jgi:hypothetical protein
MSTRFSTSILALSLIVLAQTTHGMEACAPKCLTADERNSVTLAQNSLDSWADAIDKAFHQQNSRVLVRLERGVSLTDDAINDLRSQRNQIKDPGLRQFYGALIKKLSEAKDLFSRGQDLYSQVEKNNADLGPAAAGAILGLSDQNHGAAALQAPVETLTRGMVLTGSAASYATELTALWNSIPEDFEMAAVLLRFQIDVSFGLSAHWPILGGGAYDAPDPTPGSSDEAAPKATPTPPIADAPLSQDQVDALTKLSGKSTLSVADIGTFDTDASQRIIEFCKRFAGNVSGEGNCFKDEADAYVYIQREFPNMSAQVRHICMNTPFLGNYQGLLQCARLRLRNSAGR